MKIEKNVDLSSYTSLRVGGVAKKFYRPERIEDLKKLTLVLENYYVLAAGSNLLINDACEFDHVIYMGDYEKDLLNIEDSKIIYSSSAIRIQKLLNFANKNHLGGAEYLYSLPAMVGGIVGMNAGRGKSYNKSISDYIVSVDVVENGELKTLSREECDFSYRRSNLTNTAAIIHAVKFDFDSVAVEEGKRRLKERMDFSKSKQALNLPSAGSVFKKSNGKILRFIRRIPQDKSGLYFSEKTVNWISNGGNGTYAQAKKLINRTKLVHKLFRKEIELEWHVWTDE